MSEQVDDSNAIPSRLIYVCHSLYMHVRKVLSHRSRTQSRLMFTKVSFGVDFVVTMRQLKRKDVLLCL